MSRRSAVYAELARRISGEVLDLDRVADRAFSIWLRAQQLPHEQDLFLDAVALNLHGFYSGLERLFELIARHLDDSQPSGETWHRDLVIQMARPVENLRPAVISAQNLQWLDELRRFRHLVRNVYTFNLVPGKIEPLVTSLTEMWPLLRVEILAFADFVTALAIASEGHEIG